MALALLAGVVKGYCGKKSGGTLVLASDAMLVNTVRMLACIIIGVALIALGNDITVAINTSIDGCLCAAIANGLDLLNGICNLHQPHRAGEKPGLEIGAQAEANKAKQTANMITIYFFIFYYSPYLLLIYVPHLHMIINHF